MGRGGEGGGGRRQERDREEMIGETCRGEKGEKPGSWEENWCEGGRRERGAPNE